MPSPEGRYRHRARSAGWTVGLPLGWAPAMFAGASAFVISRHLKEHEYCVYDQQLYYEAID